MKKNKMTKYKLCIIIPLQNIIFCNALMIQNT